MADIRKLDRDVKVIAISGGGQTGGFSNYLDMAERLGANASLAKPFTQQQLFEIVEVTLNGE